MRVFVTRPRHEAGGWVEDLHQRGFDAVAFPLIAILPVTDGAPLHAAWERLAQFRAAMFVSGNAVRQFFDHAPPGARWPQATRAWATGAGTHGALAAAGVDEARIDSPPASAAQFDSETLWSQVAAQVQRGDRVLVVRGGDAHGAASGRDWLADQIAAAGAFVETVVCYRRAAPELSPAQLAQAREPRAVWFFSSSEAIANLLSLVPGQDWTQAAAVATHPRIAQAARRAGFGVVRESRPEASAVAAVLESLR
jgi:uroporphyrinogen-III synthase